MSKAVAISKKNSKKLGKFLLDHMAKELADAEDFFMYYGLSTNKQRESKEFDLDLVKLKIDFPSSWWNKLNLLGTYPYNLKATVGAS